MPIKEFKCAACNHKFEDLVWLNDPDPTTCPKCGKGPVSVLIGTFRIGGLTKKSAMSDDMGDAGDPGDIAGMGDMEGMDGGDGAAGMGGDPGGGMGDFGAGGMGGDMGLGGDTDDAGGAEPPAGEDE